MPENIAQGLGTDRDCEVSAMTEANILGTDRKSSFYCTLLYFYCPDMLKIYQIKVNLFEFSQDSNREELKMKNDVILHWLRCNGFRFSRLPRFINKAAIFLDVKGF